MSEDQTLGFQKIIIDCAAKEMVTKDDFDEFFIQKTPSTKASKCFRACLSEKFGSVRFKVKSKLKMNVKLSHFIRF